MTTRKVEYYATDFSSFPLLVTGDLAKASKLVVSAEIVQFPHILERARNFIIRKLYFRACYCLLQGPRHFLESKLEYGRLSTRCASVAVAKYDTPSQSRRRLKHSDWMAEGTRRRLCSYIRVELWRFLYETTTAVVV